MDFFRRKPKPPPPNPFGYCTVHGLPLRTKLESKGEFCGKCGLALYRSVRICPAGERRGNEWNDYLAIGKVHDPWHR